MIEGTNEFRAGENLPRLGRDARLDKAARSFAEHLANGGAFSHESGGTTPEIRVFHAGYQACVVAENLARHYSSAGFATMELAVEARAGLEGFAGAPEEHARTRRGRHGARRRLSLARRSRGFLRRAAPRVP